MAGDAWYVLEQRIEKLWLVVKVLVIVVLFMVGLAVGEFLYFREALGSLEGGSALDARWMERAAEKARDGVDEQIRRAIDARVPNLSIDGGDGEYKRAMAWFHEIDSSHGRFDELRVERLRVARVEVAEWLSGPSRVVITGGGKTGALVEGYGPGGAIWFTLPTGARPNVE